jgi:hypothetical protein
LPFWTLQTWASDQALVKPLQKIPPWCGEVLRLQGGGLPLVLGEVGDAVEPHLAVGPRLHARPVDADGEVLGLPQRPDVDDALGGARAAAVHADDDVAVRDPLLRVDDLPDLVLVGRSGRHVRVFLAHEVPLVGIAVLEVQLLAVGTEGHDHGVGALGGRPVDVGTQRDAVVHHDRHVPVDEHAVAKLGLLPVSHVSPSSVELRWRA